MCCLERVKSIYVEGSFVDFIYLKSLFVMACVYFYDAKCNLYTFVYMYMFVNILVCNDIVCVYSMPVPLWAEFIYVL